MKKLLLACMSILLSVAAYAQTGTVQGRILDGANGEGLIGANVSLKGDASKGAMADFNGNYTIKNVPAGEQTLVVSFIGYISQEVNVNVTAGETTTVEVITLQSDAIGLQEVEVFASVAVDRKTPVAVSTIPAVEIETKMGNQEFPEILKTTPGVYATKSGGGYGDGRINLRGFNSENVAVMINGVPVNDMENGRVYWSNWSGLSEVTRSMQVQRGLGASKVAVPSIGGTINIITKTTDAEKGGNIYTVLGNDGFRKTGITLSTGLTENNWAVTVSAAKFQGDGYVVGTPFEGYSWFANVSKMINDNHTLSLTGFGAPQWHGQRSTRSTIETYRKSPDGTKYNPDYALLNGQYKSVEDNFYHKPQISLNHFWTIDTKTNLSTAAYVSFGSGGGGGTGGNYSYTNRLNGEYGPVNLDALVQDNQQNKDLGAVSYLRASRNDHNWYGFLSTLDRELNSDLKVMGGIDLRYYKGKHFTELTDLLGASYLVNKADRNNPNSPAFVGDTISYYNDGIVLWEGGFAQVEYSKDKLSAFVSGAVSNTSYKRIDYFNYLDSDPEQETDFVNFLGYSIKGGANYNLTENHNIFANLGYFERAPFFGSVFLNYVNDINPDAENQKITSFELGYGFRSEKFNANVNAYHTLWKDRSFVASDNYTVVIDGEEVRGNYVANLLGVNALHQGVEMDFVYKPVKAFELRGMASIGDWRWQNNLEDVAIFNEEQVEVDRINLFIEDLKVGDAAQTTLALEASYELLEDMKVGLTYNYFDNLYADFDPLDRGTAPAEGESIVQPWKVPAYSTLDLNTRYQFNIGTFEASAFANVNNLLDTEYIADAQDGSSHTYTDAAVYYGFGRTYSVGLKLKF